MTDLQRKDTADIIESLVINGDISKLTPAQKVQYYKGFCERVGLDPMAQPFKVLRMSGKEVMYCDRSGAQQLNKIHKVSHEIKAREIVSECYVVTAQAYTPDQRRTESIGAVPIKNLQGEALCNAMMKAETKAKRRATLDLLGLGMLDETEAETIPNAEKVSINLENVAPEQIEALLDKEVALDTWKQSLSEITDEAQLVKFYKSNKAVIDANNDILKLFGERKQQLKKVA